MKHNTKDVTKAWFGTKPQRLINSTSKSGKAYEKRVEIRLAAKIKKHNLDLEVIPSPWIVYENKQGTLSGCEPDILLVNYNTVFCVEVKSWRFCDGLGEVSKTYLPLLKIIYPNHHLQGIVANTKKGKFLKDLDLTGALPSLDIQLVKIA